MKALILMSCVLGCSSKATDPPAAAPTSASTKAFAAKLKALESPPSAPPSVVPSAQPAAPPSKVAGKPVPALKRLDFVRKSLRESGYPLPSDDAFLARCRTPDFRRDLNAYMSMVEFEHKGRAYSLMVEMVWDFDRKRWYAFFDGHGPDDVVFDEAPDGTYRIEWPKK